MRDGGHSSYCLFMFCEFRSEPALHLMANISFVCVLISFPFKVRSHNKDCLSCKSNYHRKAIFVIPLTLFTPQSIICLRPFPCLLLLVLSQSYRHFIENNQCETSLSINAAIKSKVKLFTHRFVFSACVRSFFLI
jgi:hypothetical protein